MGRDELIENLEEIFLIDVKVTLDLNANKGVCSFVYNNEIIEDEKLASDISEKCLRLVEQSLIDYYEK